MANMKDFLTSYYNRLIFLEMSHEQFVQFCGYITDKKATDNQKIWAEELLKRDPADPSKFATITGTKIYIRKDLPDPADPTEGLDPKEWEKLFKAFRDAFQSMDGAKSAFKYNEKAKKFFEAYFGTNPTTGLQNMFQHEKLKPYIESRLYKAPTPPSTTTVPGTLYAFLEKYRNVLESRFSGGYYSILDDSFSYDDLLNGLKNKKYNTNASFRHKLDAVAGFISGYDNDLIQAGIPQNDIPYLSDYRDWYDNSIDPYRLDQFKREYTTLLNTLRTDSKVREVFEQHDRGKISGPLNKAISSLKYNDANSEDYVLPKRPETMTIPETISEWWADTYSNCMEKYTKLCGDRLFFSPQAKAIAKHLTKEFDKTGGLDAAMKNIGTAEEKLKAARDFTSVKHLKWFKDTLNGIKADPKMSKVWAGALKNGTHMQALIKEIIIRAVKEGKKEEAKTTMELISVMHYDFTTSKIMDALSKENLTLFSDGKLSWNKHEGVQMVTNALDKGVNFALRAIGYGITMAGNAINLSGRKITKYSDKAGNLSKEHDNLLKKQANDKAALSTMLADEQHQLTVTQPKVDRVLAGLDYGLVKTNIENDLQRFQRSAGNLRQAIQKDKAQLMDNLYDSTTGSYLVSRRDLNLISDFLDKLNSPTPPTTIPTLATPTITTSTGPYDINRTLKRILSRQQVLKTRTDSETNAQADLNTLVNGTALIKQLNDQITRHQDELRNWDANHTDEMEELIQYWNRLETGRLTKSGPMYNWFRNINAKNAQKRLDNDKAAIIAHYNSRHSIAA